MNNGGSMEKAPNLGRYAIRIPTEIQVGTFYRSNQPAVSTTRESTNNVIVSSKETNIHGLVQQAIRSRAGSVVSQLTSADSESSTPPSQSNDEFSRGLTSQQDKYSALESRLTKQGNTRKESPDPSTSQPTNPSTGPNSALYIDTQISSVLATNCNNDETHESIVVNVNPAVYNSTSEETTIFSQTNGGDNHAYGPYNPVFYTPNVPKQTKKKTYPKQGPYDKILSGVIFVMSGYENPRRSKLRDMAIEMGAKYQPAWNRFCTHLICAFKNTPKYKEVMAENGRVVREHWIQECSRQRQLIDWRNYKLGKYPYPDSEDEVDVDDLDYALKASHRVQTTSK